MMEIIANQKAPHQSPHPSMLLSVFPRAALKRIAEAVAFVYNVEFPGRARRSRGGKGGDANLPSDWNQGDRGKIG